MKVKTKVKMKAIKKKCSRCKSKKIDSRLDGSKWCKNCGQRWDVAGNEIISFDRRVFKKERSKIKRGK